MVFLLECNMILLFLNYSNRNEFKMHFYYRKWKPFFDVAPRNGCGKGVLKFSDIEKAAQLFYDPNFPVFTLALSLSSDK